MKPAIRVKDLSKLYHIGSLQRGPKTLKAALAENLSVPWQRKKRRPIGDGSVNGHTEADTIWALKDVSFEVNPGEVIGVVGANGSGKSTLMKILSRVTAPTSGRVELRGRVGSLLEVGTGFDPEFTGRENIYLSGPILGMTRQEIEAKFDQIVEFADIDQFLDTPVKHYSSGMQMRLGFAVAAHMDPEILLVDEALSVGDASFQNRCLARLTALAKSGRTVLFVSHDSELILQLCSRALILHKGRLQLEGPPSSVIKEYLTVLLGAEQKDPPSPATASVNEEALHDLLDTPPEEAPLAPLAHEVASTMLEHLPGLLADELVHRLGPSLGGYVAEYLVSALPSMSGWVTEEADTELEETEPGVVEPDPETVDFRRTAPPDLDAAPGPKEETAWQLRNWDHGLAGYAEYVREATAADLDVNDWIEAFLGWGNCRLLCRHILRPYLTETARVCELGPGLGRWARHVAPRVSKGEYHLVESDPWLVTFLRRYFEDQPHVRLWPLEGVTLPCPNAGSFDLAFALDVFFGYQLGRADLFIREFARILRPGGTCVIQYVDATEPRVWDFLRNYGNNPPVYADSFTYHPPELLDRVFRAAGFEIERRVALDEIYRDYPFTTLIATRK